MGEGGKSNILIAFQKYPKAKLLKREAVYSSCERRCIMQAARSILPFLHYAKRQKKNIPLIIHHRKNYDEL
jgi:hypothetical protein